MRSHTTRRLLLLLLCLPVAAGSGCHQPVAATHRDVEQRQEEAQLDREEGQDTLWSLAAVAAVGVILIPVYGITYWVDRSNGLNPATYARMMDQGTTADQRREGLAKLVTKYDFTRRRPYSTRYRQIAVNDPDYTVRAMAIRALNICRDAGATPIFIAALDDREELVRLEAAKALANIPDPNAVQPLLRILEGRRPPALVEAGDNATESKDVRIAAADALRHYPTLDVARTLVSVLGERDFGIAWQSRRSLVLLTRHDLHYDQSAWLSYLAGTPNPFG